MRSADPGASAPRTTPAGTLPVEGPAGVGVGSAGADPSPTAGEPGRARRAWGRARWWVRQLSGEARYDAYVAHHRVHHPDEEPMSVREFWRSEHARQEANPGSRCC